MSKFERVKRFLPRGNRLVVLLYTGFFAVLLGQAARGIGQYWDWSFPYYAEQVGNFFGRASEAWTPLAQGSPLGYSSDYFVRWVISLFGWLQPEWLLYGLLVTLFTVGGFGVYIIARHHCKPGIAFLLGLAAFVNPTMFYKFTAGHIDYLISYVLLIYMVWFLLHRFRPNFRSAVVVGLLWALIGAQIQFLAIAGGLIVMYFIFRPDMWRWKFLAPLLLLPLLGNAVWLSNFAFGGADIAAISGEATKGTFRAASNSEYLNSFNFSFSKATLINKFYGVYELLLYGLLFVLMVVALLKYKGKQMEDVWLLTFMLVMLFLATGLFQLINLGPLTTLYPMFREVGHFAPVIVLVLLVLLGRLMPRGFMKGAIALWLVIVVVLSFLRFQGAAQSIDFAAARQKFTEFKDFDKNHPEPNGRILAYPFFGQYSFNDFPRQFQSNLPMRNSGHDGFSTYSLNDFIKNSVKPQDFKLSMQFQLLSTLNIDVLKPYNVRYIYDFSDIYESYYDRYVAPSTYDGNLGWIKNNPNFMEQLIAANPGKVKRVSDHILEITNPTPRITAVDKLYAVDSKDDGELARTFMTLAFPDQTYDYIDKTISRMPDNAGTLKPLLANATPGLIDAKGKSLTETIDVDPAKPTKLYTASVPSTIAYQAIDGNVTFFAANPGKFYANGQLVSDGLAAEPTILAQIKMPPGKQYYIGLGSTLKPIQRNGGEVVGRLGNNTMLELFADVSGNLVTNSSFESGLWSSSVGDCNAFDDKPDISMKQSSDTASVGKKSLELSAKKHDACTSTGFQMKGNSLYLLNYDYQSPNADMASFFLRFNNSDKDAMKRFQTISDDKWHTATYPIITPQDTSSGQLFVHSVGSSEDEATINRYDNVSMVELSKVGEFPIQTSAATYKTHDLSAGKNTFHFVDKTYDYQNVIVNGSFEDGPWRKKVFDCNNYDKSPKVDMRMNTSAKSDGNQSLELEVAHHTACTYTNVNIEPGTEYLLSFDYQAKGDGQIGYYAEFDGVEAGSQDRFTPEKGDGWHTYTTKITTPSATSMRLFLHAYESDGTNVSTMRFDNVKLVAIPPVNQQFYVLGEPQAPQALPQKIEFSNDSQARRSVTVRGATGKFTLLLSESYHPSWRLEMRDGAAATWQPGANVRAVGEHFVASGYANGWLIDPATICANGGEGCKKNADGSYDIELLAEFVPQRWFEVNRVLSIATLVVAGGYIAITHRKTKQSHESEGIYRHPLARRRRK